MDKNRIMMIVIIALLVILLGTIAFVSIYALNLISKQPTAEESISTSGETTEVISIVQKDITTVDYDTAVKAIIMDANDASHALTFKVAIGVDNSDKKKEKDVTELVTLLTDRETVVKSFINEIIYNHTHDEYYNNNDVISKTLSTEILERLQLEFGSNLLVSIYLSEYLYQ